ncbi:MAG: 4Fe-4S binding protein [candidate division FCPU426 bacterium]
MTEWWQALGGWAAEAGSTAIAHLKLLERALLGLEDSYVELLTVLALGLLAALPVVVPRRHRQVWRRLTQVFGIFIFIFVVYTCMGVFGMISNFFRGFGEIGRENILALYFASVPVTILVTSLLFGPFFCGWICPTGSSQEFLGLLTRSWHQRRQAAGFPFSRVFFIGSLLLTAFFLLWLYQLSVTRIFFAEDATVYWSLIVVVLLLLMSWKLAAWDGPLRRLKHLSFFLVVAAAVVHVRITSPVHFGFAKVVDPASILATVIVVAAALLLPRIWCRYLCPWRLAISWASRYSPRRIEFTAGRCTRCGRCTLACDIGAIRNGVVNPRECHMCLRCVDLCPENALELKEEWRKDSEAGPACPQ